jgi:hypothetical protein
MFLKILISPTSFLVVFTINESRGDSSVYRAIESICSTHEGSNKPSSSSLLFNLHHFLTALLYIPLPLHVHR